MGQPTGEPERERRQRYPLDARDRRLQDPRPAGRLGDNAEHVLSVRLANTGDRRAAPTSARLALSRDTKSGDDLPLENVRIPALAPGRKQTIDLKFAIPTNAQARGYRYLVITLDATRKVTEYSESNNTSYIPLP